MNNWEAFLIAFIIGLFIGGGILVGLALIAEEIKGIGGIIRSINTKEDNRKPHQPVLFNRWWRYKKGE